MAEALAKSGSNRSAVRAVCLAVSGVNHASDQQRILDWLRYYLHSYYLLFHHNVYDICVRVHIAHTLVRLLLTIINFWLKLLTL